MPQPFSSYSYDHSGAHHCVVHPMIHLSHAVLLAGLAAVAFSPLAAHADYSKCTGKIRSMGYFITDIDSDWGRPYDKFDVIKDGKEYNVWVNKNSCKIEQTTIDNEYRRWND